MRRPDGKGGGMKLPTLDDAYKVIRPRLMGVLLASLVYGVPVYALVWGSGFFDDLSDRLLLSVLVAVVLVVELLSGPRPLKSRWDMLVFAIFIVPVSLFAIGHKFNLPALSLNAAVLVVFLPFCWLAWLLMGRSWLLSTGLVLTSALMMVYWVVASSEVGDSLETLTLPLLMVVFGGIFWAPTARVTLHFAKRLKCRRVVGPGMQALAMFILLSPVILVAVVVPWMLELEEIWLAASLTLAGVLLSTAIAEPLRRCLLEWGNLNPKADNVKRVVAEHLLRKTE